MLIKIPDLWTPAMSAQELHEATRHWWRVSERCTEAKYVFSISHGVIREVYEVESWRPWIAEEADKDGGRWDSTATWHRNWRTTPHQHRALVQGRSSEPDSLRELPMSRLFLGRPNLFAASAYMVSQ